MKIVRNLVVALLLPAAGAWAWSGQETVENGVRLFIEELAPVADPAAPSPVQVTVSNGAAAELRATLELRDFADDWKAVGPAKAEVVLRPGAATNLAFRIASGPFVFDALYPVHAYLSAVGAVEPLHAVRIFEVKRPVAARAKSAAAPAAVAKLEADAALPLWVLKSQRFGWVYDKGGAPVWHPAGWTGSDPVSHTNCFMQAVDCGGSREAIGMHPPFEGGAGRCWCEWTVELPDTKPLALTFATSLFHSGETDKQRSDGVCYRVLVADAAASNEWKTLHEDFTDARRWKEGRVDLGAYAGRRILLRLESDPGPKRNTAFDQSFWAEPALVSGSGRAAARRLEAPAPQDTVAVLAKAKALLDGTAKPDGRTAFLLGGGGAPKSAVVVETGAQGLFDGLFAFAVEGGGAGACRGLEIDIEGLPAGRFPSPYAFRGVDVRSAHGGAKYVHTFAQGREKLEITVTLSAEGPALRAKAECARRITRLRTGAWDRAAPRVFWGHGFCVSDPKPFRMHPGGHNLAASHVAFEFEGGLALLEAVDTPPDFLDVDPGRRIYALQTHLDSTLTLLPGRAAMACALAYRPLDPRRGSDGVPVLAGRYCFDIWGGAYAAIATNMAKMIRYGLTDSFLTIHDWQRWGYDYRLPDIWPPNPRYGTVADLRGVGDLCRAKGILWGLHDNYIDLYPDASGYTYRDVYFTADGRPQPAWYNEGREARSYKFSPDSIMPFVKRNYRLIRDEVHPNHCFVDVFTSQPCGDYYDVGGRFHPSTDMQRNWGEMFAWIRNCLGEHAPTTSEAGDDHLIGWLDGADCQWLRLTAERPAIHSIFLDCGAWTRVPWFDAVHHDRFILHGAGYSVRFEGGLGRHAHGINSDEYLATELLGGHALMTDAGSWGRPAVRKYWLAQDIARALAMRSIRAHAFDGARLDRQRIEWDNGAVVQVNLGADDWAVDGAVLPPNGWRAAAGGCTASVERVAGRVVERASAPASRYCNARTASVEHEARRLNVRPRLESAARGDDGRLRYTLVWDCKSRLGRDNTMFVHFVKEDGETGFGDIVWQDDFKPVPPTQDWKGVQRFERTVPVPASAAGRYRVMVGIFDKHSRKLLQGRDDGESRIWLGMLDVKPGADGRPGGIAFAPAPETAGLPPWLNPPETVTDFGWAATDGAFRVERGAKGWHLIPLPELEPFAVTLRLAALPGGPVKIRAIVAEPVDPAVAEKPVEFQSADGAVSFRHDGESFAYRLVAE